MVAQQQTKGRLDQSKEQSSTMELGSKWVNGIAKMIEGRSERYGAPITNFSVIAKGWSEILGVEVTPEKVALCQIWLKMTRIKNSPGHEDSWDDIVGYSIIAKMCDAES